MLGMWKIVYNIDYINEALNHVDYEKETDNVECWLCMRLIFDCWLH